MNILYYMEFKMNVRHIGKVKISVAIILKHNKKEFTRRSP